MAVNIVHARESENICVNDQESDILRVCFSYNFVSTILLLRSFVPTFAQKFHVLERNHEHALISCVGTQMLSARVFMYVYVLYVCLCVCVCPDEK